MRHEKNHSIRNTLLLLAAAAIWGFAFAFQSMATDYMGPFTFLAARSWVATVFLCPVVAINQRFGLNTGINQEESRKDNKKQMLMAGLILGFLLFAASAAQQAGLAYTTTAKSGFITALYVLLVPILMFVLGKRPAKTIWISVILALVGLYFLCFTGEIGGFNRGDLFTLFSALMFTFQITAVGHFSKKIEGIKLNLMQMLMTAIFATVAAMIFESPSVEALKAAIVSILYVGIMSSGVAYTLQIMGQKNLEPTIAAIAMCMESVFSALGGWMLLGETLSIKEAAGCALMFAGIVLAQLPEKSKE